jgi:predicted RNase H-like HicB family nuclease
MTEYALYVESGPRRRKTQVHVLDLLGCVVQGPTTEETLAATPAAIRAYLRFVQRHGEAADPEAPFTTRLVAHVTEGSWIGNGDPIPGFAPDFQPLAEDDLQIYLRRLAGLQAELGQRIRDVPPAQLEAEPPAGRSMAHILQHVGAAHGVYVRYTVGKVDGLSAALKAVEQGTDLPAALAQVWAVTNARLAIMTAPERTQVVPHGQLTWTARRGLRRMLEHLWEHLGELEQRLDGNGGEVGCPGGMQRKARGPRDSHAWASRLYAGKGDPRERREQG